MQDTESAPQQGQISLVSNTKTKTTSSTTAHIAEIDTSLSSHACSQDVQSKNQGGTKAPFLIL